MPARSGGKDIKMWVFDGEQWTDEGGSDKPRTPAAAFPAYDESMPELQVIEYFPVPPMPGLNYFPQPQP